VANPGYYNFLWALGEHDWDAQEVQRVHDLDAASVRRYLMTLQRMGFVEVRGTVVRSGHRGQTGRQMHAELGDRVVRTLQDTLLEHARDRIRGSGHPLPKATECGLGRMRLTPASVADFKGALRETVREFARRARRESALNAPSDLVQVGVLTVMAPCSFDRALTIERLPE
jgi:hypothetical protein